MRTLPIRLFAVSTLVLVTAAGIAACGSTASNPDDGNTGGSGNTTGGGGSGNVGGPLTPADAVITGTVLQCPGTAPGALPDVTVNACVAPGCANAACVSQDLIAQFAPTTDLSLLGTCGDPTIKCLPIDFIATTGQFLVKSCTSLLGAEGRCMSKCIPRVAQFATYLPVDTCGVDELCAPCFDPIDGANTTACNQGCDTGPVNPTPITFPACGAGLGKCVPAELIPPEYATAVPQADCQPGQACAPISKILDINAPFPVCTPSSVILMQVPGLPGPNGEMGGCVPAYLVDAVQPPPPDGAVLEDGCGAGFLCAPCTNPLANQAPTGACPLAPAAP